MARPDPLIHGRARQLVADDVQVDLTVTTDIMASLIRVDKSADVAETVRLGAGTTVWHLAQIREEATLGDSCIVGRGAYVGPGVVIGTGCKLQNYALVYEPAVLEDGVFIGPGAVLTNDRYPRAVTPDLASKQADDWCPVGVTVRRGASIGARAVCVAPVSIGAWALIAAGAVVVRSVPDFALMAGTPARQIGWVGRAGARLTADRPGRWRCPQTSETYHETGGVLRRMEEDGSEPQA